LPYVANVIKPFFSFVNDEEKKGFYGTLLEKTIEAQNFSGFLRAKHDF